MAFDINALNEQIVNNRINNNLKIAARPQKAYEKNIVNFSIYSMLCRRSVC